MLLWTTTLQGESLALALHLQAREDFEVLVVTTRPEAMRGEPIAKLTPLMPSILDRAAPDTDARSLDFQADVVVFDNHVPPRKYGPKLCSLWHGLGWKARPAADLRTYYREVERAVGSDPRRPSPDFMAHCYGRRDRDWRVERWRLDPGACKIVGMPMIDLLRAPPYPRDALVPWYPELEIGRRKTVAFSLTWHFGRIFPGDWKGVGLLRHTSTIGDFTFLREMVELVLSENGQVLLCLHDRHRYEPAFLHAIDRAVRDLPRVHVKHKDDRPDNLADLLLADVMVTNLSSFAAYHYVSGRPSVHLVPEGDRPVTFARMRRGRILSRRDSVDWMNDPRETGGLVAADREQALSALRVALARPDCCRERAQAWLEARVEGIDIGSCARLCAALQELVGVDRD